MSQPFLILHVSLYQPDCKAIKWAQAAREEGLKLSVDLSSISRCGVLYEASLWFAPQRIMSVWGRRQQDPIAEAAVSFFTSVHTAWCYCVWTQHFFRKCFSCPCVCGVLCVYVREKVGEARINAVLSKEPTWWSSQSSGRWKEKETWHQKYKNWSKNIFGWTLLKENCKSCHNIFWQGKK